MRLRNQRTGASSIPPVKAHYSRLRTEVRNLDSLLSGAAAERTVSVEELLLLSQGGVAAPSIRCPEGTSYWRSGWLVQQPLISLTSTTPAAATASAFPSSAEEG